ncbi:hypothetical protein CRG98_025000 [Punica granatum]|uniref:Uncharacterized protein n=1 Tax=Punica granatum TaxID=22663 RepID=A0A2I0JFQ1_PUNGR|nr:hypothetical protein CRG98_025000 [Punica granatum]
MWELRLFNRKIRANILSKGHLSLDPRARDSRAPWLGSLWCCGPNHGAPKPPAALDLGPPRWLKPFREILSHIWLGEAKSSLAFAGSKIAEMVSRFCRRWKSCDDDDRGGGTRGGAIEKFDE